MTTENGTWSPGTTSDKLSAAKRALFDALRTGEGGAPLLRTLLGTTKLPDEQQAFVDLLMIEMEKPAPANGDDGEAAGARAGEAPIDPQELADLRQELADLREANDTVAAALGACPYCWGGNRHCEVCRGWGHAGFTEPDPELFNGLVLPAIQRARAIKRAGSRPPSGRARS